MLLKIIIFIVVIYLVVRFFSRLLLSLFISNISNKVSQAQNNFNKGNTRNKEGEVIINSSKRTEKKYNVKEGDYVDFEEIKD